MRARLIAVAVAVGALVVGSAVGFGLIVWDDSMRAPNAFGGGPALNALMLVVPLTIATFFGAVGVAVAPTRIVAGGGVKLFAAGMALAGLSVAFAMAVQAACITWPLGLVCLLGAIGLFVGSFRVAKMQATTTPSGDVQA